MNIRTLRGALPACALTAVVLAACGGPSSPSNPSPQGAEIVSVAPTPTPRPGPPDIIVMLADDMGWGDLSVYGHPLARTPNIDRLAAEGARFEAMYVPSPVCAPSRAALLTGRYGIRNGVRWNDSSTLRPGEITIAKLLKSAGYQTAAVGKWHLGATAPDLPLRHGFDSFYGMMSSPPVTQFVLGEQITSDFPGMDLVTKRLTDEATAVIRKASSERPLLLYLAHHAPHHPNFSSAAFVGRSGSGDYGDAMQELDWSVGEVMRVMKETGRDRNALVIFMSDNGPIAAGSPGPFTYGKGNVNEGGIRVPAIAWRPGRIPAGRVIKDAASSVDLFPSFAALAGVGLPPRDYDGVDISRLLEGDVEWMPGPGVGGRREMFFFIHSEVAAIRSGRWKYVRPGFRDSVPVLYDIEADPGELNSLRRVHPEIASQLEKRISQFR